MHNAQSVAKTYIMLTQQKKEHNVNKHQRLVDFEPKDKVQVKATNQSTNCPSKKLSKQMGGPWPVLAKEGHSYRVQLLALMKIHPVFPVGSLCQDPGNLLPS